MNKIQINEAEYLNKVQACWLGKNIGGTLGAPYETKKTMNDLTFYDPIPEKPAPNDDLDLQLIWLIMLEDIGVNPSLYHFAEYWKKYAIAYPWNEYGFLRRNLKRGLMPPIAGCFENYFLDEMGAPIRSEIWACISPGDPQLAAATAWKDAVLDHAGGEGMHGEMFWAAVESAAFVINDPKQLIEIGLNMIPLSSAISRVTREVLWCHENGLTWKETRKRIILYYGHNSPCHAPQNHGFTLLGWLYGNDFGDKLCKAVNCGYDTDCTAATLGALLGILNGLEYIPKKWSDPIGEKIVLHLLTRKGNLKNPPRNIHELTNRIFKITKQFLIKNSKTSILGEKTTLPENLYSLLFQNEKAHHVLRSDIHAAVSLVNDIEITLHYFGEPVIKPGVDKILGISLKKNGFKLKNNVFLEVPNGWEVQFLDDEFEQKRFIIRASEIQNFNIIHVCLPQINENKKIKFVILGPNEAQGYPSGINIPRPSFKGSDKEWLEKIGISKKRLKENSIRKKND
ncbi:MAG: ADP-ribosylglycohydrolase family protein [Promethearchaeota archaeon]